jgi:hypothetical protein
MIPWALVYDEHYQRFCELNVKSDDLDTFQQFLKEIGTPSLLFQTPNERKVATSVVYKQVPYSSCIRLHTPENYAAVVHKTLYPKLREKQDKSERSNSCTVM